MGSLYFVLKNSIITIIIVCLLQIQISSKSLEERLMTFVRHTIAPKFLGTETTYITNESLQLSPKDLGNIRKKIYNSSAFKGLQKNAKDVFLKEMTEVIKQSQDKKLKEFEKIDKLGQEPKKD